MLALIPARGGSKGIRGKNLKPLCGRPLIEYTIQSAKASKEISRIVVSTDSVEIADVALKAGAEVPFLRPDYLASDNALAIDNYIYTCERLNNDHGINIDQLVVLQPTSPLRTAEDIDSAISIFSKKNADSVISVVEAGHPVQWYKRIDDNGILREYFSKASLDNRQSLERTFLPNGAIYVFRFKLLLDKRYYSERTYPYIMPMERSVDIDTLFDFDMAEYLMKKERKSGE